MPSIIRLNDDVGIDLDEYEQQGFRAAILGSSGSGKSYALGKMLEGVHALGIPMIMLDPESELWTFTELGALVVGGAHGDVEYVADDRLIDRVIAHAFETATPVVFDLGVFADRGDAAVQAAGEQIMRRVWSQVDAARRYIALAVTEAHLFAPQQIPRGALRPEVLSTMSSRGRKRGLHMFIETQRPASIAKAVLSLFNVRLFGRIDDTIDFEAVKRHLPRDSSLVEMAALPTGTFYMKGEGWVRIGARDVTHGGGVRAAEQVVPARRARGSGGLIKELREIITAASAPEPVSAADEAPMRRGDDRRIEITRLTREHDARIAAVTGERDRAAAERDEAQQEASAVAAALAETEEAMSGVEAMRTAFASVFDTAVPRAGAPAAGGITEARVREIAAEVAMANGAGPAIQVTPVEKLRADYLERSAQRVVETIRDLDERSRDVLLFVIAHESGNTQTQIAKALTGQSGGSASSAIGTILKDLATLGVVEQYKSGNNRPYRLTLDRWVASSLVGHDPPADAAEQIKNRAIFVLG